MKMPCPLPVPSCRALCLAALIAATWPGAASAAEAAAPAPASPDSKFNLSLHYATNRTTNFAGRRWGLQGS